VFLRGADNVPPSEGYVTTSDGVRLFFRKLGTGSPAVIIPNAVHMFESFRRLADYRTIIFFDLRNRGASDSVSDSSKLAKGIQHDVDDLEAVRQYFGLEKVDMVGHSYLGLMVILYALQHPKHVNRVVQIGPAQPNAAKQYPSHLTGADQTLAVFAKKLGEEPRMACRDFWELIKVLMVAHPADASKINWTPCDYPNEIGFMKHWSENILPSILRLSLPAEEVRKVKAPVLTIHGARDRQAPYGGGREWALMLPNARLITVEDAAHVPWIEAPEKVFGSIETFLRGAWPQAAETVTSLDPKS
jgi:proline iminopeptidase